jgi:hypothetical protein
LTRYFLGLDSCIMLNCFETNCFHFTRYFVGLGLNGFQLICRFFQSHSAPHPRHYDACALACKCFSFAGAQLQLLLLFLPTSNICFVDLITPLCNNICWFSSICSNFLLEFRSMICVMLNVNNIDQKKNRTFGILSNWLLRSSIVNPNSSSSATRYQKSSCLGQKWASPHTSHKDVVHSTVYY